MVLELLASVCLTGSGDFTAPKSVCTPGAYDHPTCLSVERPYLPVAERRKVLRRYRAANWNGQMGELDHRVPFFLGGSTDARNLWPERGRIPNPKDRLEFYIYRRVCVKHTMTVRTARRIFLTDWRVWHSRYSPF